MRFVFADCLSDVYYRMKFCYKMAQKIILKLMYFTGGKPQGSLGKKFRNQAQQNCHSVTSSTGFCLLVASGTFARQNRFHRICIRKLFLSSFSLLYHEPQSKVDIGRYYDSRIIGIFGSNKVQRVNDNHLTTT